MSAAPKIKILCGGISDEREVSLRTGDSIFKALKEDFNAELICLDENRIPEGIKADEDLVFPAIHGQYGEDGGLQDQLDLEGIIFAGCDAQSSRLCMHKSKSKQKVAEASVPVLSELIFKAMSLPDTKQVINELGSELIVKPVGSGSSVGLYAPDGAEDLSKVFSELDANVYTGSWMIEPRVTGRELTIGMLNGKAMGIVEIIPDSGLYDYEHKYTAGHTNYRFPAEVAPEIAEAATTYAEKAFEACGCRDFARIDFMYSDEGNLSFLEINTIPGLTDTSLMPKSASAVGIEFNELVKSMLSPAIERFSHLTQSGAV